MLSEDKPTGQVRITRQRMIEGAGHLWVYAGHIGQVTGRPASGDVVDVVAPNGRFYGRGLFNPVSKIRVRLLTRADEPIDQAFWARRIDQASRLRQCVVSETTAYRLVYGEADLLPGLVIDRYGDVAVMQTLSAGIDQRKELLADLLLNTTGVRSVFLRNDAKSRQLEGLPGERGYIRGGGATQVEIREGPARFLVDIERGQKTGWFCDQRENRLAAARLARGGEVLEVFCHTGAFGIQAALAGATFVEGLDVSEDSLSLARHHARQNGVEGRCSYRGADAFDELRRLVKLGRRYDLVTLDPPAFARSQQALSRALAGYKDVNLLGLKLVKPEGFMVTCSCSHPVTEEDFWKAVRLAARDAGRDIRLIEQRGQSPDHPILGGMPETRYLKCLILQVL
ncbi:class I SAM-dependent rRNA methyltransferase [Nitrospira moscoviensis]|uniref:Ribosomal RNA large subunit methyltransferase I n=1 Tax=Nitrospira moscoviensis TaxID=42253 RepID=A0A0K2GG23_NITMO|nr:class I SAM-dependent rRNA methyltransferase [Nitrospira moscoviensis]ALA59567.1 Ribosomal RNA large subunit methyltransferase I [Nitrospira moscoviensis]